MSFKEFVCSGIEKIEGACSVYARTMDKTEVKIMSTCGSDRTMDDVVEDYVGRGWTKTVKAGGVVVEKTTKVTKATVAKVKEKAPLVAVANVAKATVAKVKEKTSVPAVAVAKAAVTVKDKVKDKVTKDKTNKEILDDMAQDKDLAAALHYVYMNPCIKVTVTEIQDSKDVVCDGSAPLVSTRLKNDSALKAGMCGQARKPAPMSAMSRMKSFVLKATSTKLVTVS